MRTVRLNTGDSVVVGTPPLVVASRFRPSTTVMDTMKSGCPAVGRGKRTINTISQTKPATVAQASIAGVSSSQDFSC
jgi:hypothetical protein